VSFRTQILYFTLANIYTSLECLSEDIQSLIEDSRKQDFGIHILFLVFTELFPTDIFLQSFYCYLIQN